MAKLPNITEDRQVAQAGVNQGISPSNLQISPVTEATNHLGGAITQAAVELRHSDEQQQKFNYALNKNRLITQHAELVDTIDQDIAKNGDYAGAHQVYQQSLKEITKNLSTDLDPKYKELLGVESQSLGSASSSKIEELQRQAQQNHAQTLTNQQLDDNLRFITSTNNPALQGDLIKSSKALIAASVPFGPNRDTQVQGLDKQFSSKVGEGLFDKMSPVQQINAIDQYYKDPKKPSTIGFLPAEKVPELRARAVAQVQATIKTDVREQVNDIEQAGRMGLNVPKEKILAVAAKARSAGMTDVSSALEKYSVVQDASNEFSRKSLGEQQKDLVNTRNNIEAGNIADVDKYRAFEQVYDTKLKILKEDPRSYYAAHDVITPTQPMEIGNPNSIAQVVAERRIQNQKVKSVEGNNFELPMLNKQEIDQLKTMNQTASPDKMGAVLNNIGSNLFPSERASLARQLSKEDAPTLAVAMSLPHKDAINILSGSKLKGEVSPDKLRRETASKLSGLVIDPEQSEVFQSAIYDYYKKLAFDTGNVEKDVDTDLLDKAIEKTAGKPVEISPAGKRSKVFTYRDDSGNLVSESNLEDTFSSIDDDVLKKSNGSLPLLPSGDVVNAKEILKDTKLVTYGNGLYVPYYEGVGFLTGQDGQPYVLDAKKIKAITGNVPAKGKIQTRASQSIFGYN